MAEPSLNAICIIPLNLAVLCEDCHAVTNGIRSCPACGSTALSNLACWMEPSDIELEKSTKGENNHELQENH